MTIKEVVEKEMRKYRTSSVYRLLEYHDIELFYLDDLERYPDSRLIVYEGLGNIFIKETLDEHYQNFLLAHELGHFLLHYDENISFAFYRDHYKSKIEREANEFACRLLTQDIDFYHEENPQYLIMEKGIPMNIWLSLQDQIVEKKEEDSFASVY